MIVLDFIITFIQNYWKIIPFSAIFIFLYKRNQSYKKIISDFNEKLPPTHKKATPLKTKFIFNVINTNSHSPSLSQNDIDSFFKRIEEFDYRFIVFKSYIKNHIKNLLRFKNATNIPGDINLVMVQEIIESNRQPVDFIKIIIYKLRKLTNY